MAELAELRALRPELLVVPDEPYPFGERHRRELETVAPVAFVDGKDLFWWGVRTPAALARLGEQVRAWVRRGPDERRVESRRIETVE